MSVEGGREEKVEEVRKWRGNAGRSCSLYATSECRSHRRLRSFEGARRARTSSLPQRCGTNEKKGGNGNAQEGSIVVHGGVVEALGSEFLLELQA
jgi:hypothetical protein